MDKAGQAVNDWNAGKIPMLFIHPQSAGHGLNMQLGPGHILIFADTPASLELYLQTIKRIARSGQKRLVRVVHLVARGTVEQYAVPKLMAKESAQDAFTNYLRAIRKKLTRRAV
jgi:SNF2 family DNA or RNA helicase